MKQDDKKELEFLGAWATCAGEYLDALNSGGRVPVFSGPVEDCLRAADLRSLRAYKNDLYHVATALPKHEYAELDRLLKERFGMGLRGKLTSEEIAFNNVLQRGKIIDEDEYRMLEERAEEIWDDPTKADELERVNKLLSAY